MSRKATREAGEERHVGRGVLPFFVFGVAVREIDADADDLLGVGDRDIPLEAAERMSYGNILISLLVYFPHICRDHRPQGSPIEKGI